jgi:hypothetical protein
MAKVYCGTDVGTEVGGGGAEYNVVDGPTQLVDDVLERQPMTSPAESVLVYGHGFGTVV